MSVLPAPTERMTIPTTKPMSATRVTRKALYAARLADSRALTWPMSRNEHQPMTSHPTRVSTRSPDWTTSSIAARNRDTVDAKTAYRGSSRRYQTENTCTASPTTATATAMPAEVRSARRLSGICSSPTGRGPNVGTTSDRPAVSANWNTDSTRTSAAAATATNPENARRGRSSSPTRPANAGMRTSSCTVATVSTVTGWPPRPRAR